MISSTRIAVAFIGCLAAAVQQASAYEEVSVDSISLTDISTGVSDIATIHNDRPFSVHASLNWDEQVYDSNSENVLSWAMSINDVLMQTGQVTLSEDQALPTTLEAGQATITSSGTNNIKVSIILDDNESANDSDYQSFAAPASFVPLVIVILFALATQMVELSLGIGIFTGACMVAGTLVGGFRSTLDVYILKALANEDHAYVFLFILFMAGLVGLIEKSGGLAGITVALKQYVKSSRSAQGASFLSGLIIFFDDYANTLVAGASMRPLTDACVVSREKLAFIVDATAAPIASIVPISSWVGFEISLIQDELNAILAEDPNSAIGNMSAFSVFIQTIRFRYYCIFMLFLIPLIILSGRDFGPMLIAERLTKVYGRTDGGPGRAVAADGHEIVSHNAPKPDTPAKWWNMAFPILSLVFYIFYLLWWTGKESIGEGWQAASFTTIMESSNSYQALLWGTMAAALTALAFYFIQDKKDGRIIFFNVPGYVNKMKRFFARHRGACHRGERIDEEMAALDGEEQQEQEHAKVLMGYKQAMSAFLMGMEKIFGACVVLTLAWATGAIMKAVGLNRLFGEILTNPALDYRMLPTLTFIVAVLIALSTGTSWGTMTIMFPLVLVPSYHASNGDATIFYGVTAAILAGAVAGDHASPISDTTILASMASECLIFNHVRTQAPYALLVSIWSILVGTIPSGRGVPNWVSILLGFVMMLLHVAFTSEFAINKTGRYDIFTEIYLKCTRNKDFLLKLKEDTVTAFETGEPVPLLEKSDEEHGSSVSLKASEMKTSVELPEDLSNASEVSSKQEQAPELHASHAEPIIEEHGHNHEHMA